MSKELVSDHDIAYRDLERKCKALEADYIISNRELLVKQVEIQRLTARIAELEAEIDQLTAHSDIERQDDKSPNDTQTSTIVYGKESEE